jgi:hypothetical protein
LIALKTALLSAHIALRTCFAFLLYTDVFILDFLLFVGGCLLAENVVVRVHPIVEEAKQ